MVERRNERQDGTFVPPTPENIKPKGSRDSAVEMAAGGQHERETLDAQREKMASASRATDDPGRTDNPLGTGVGYAGEGSAAYGEQEKRMSTNEPKRPDGTDMRTTPTQHQPEQQHHQQSSSGQKPGAGGTEASKGAIGGPQDHGTVKTPQGQNVSTQGHGLANEGQQKADDVKSQAQATAGDLKQQAREKIGDRKETVSNTMGDLKDQGQAKMADIQQQAQGRLDTVTSQAQDTLESVKANLQTRTDALKGTVTDKADQLRGTMTGKTDQLVGTVGEKGDLAKQAANEKSTQAGERLAELADSLREKTQTLEPDHPVTNVATKAAEALEQTGAYLQQSTPDDWMGDLKQLISRKPVESVLIAAGLGYMAARAFRK